MLAALGKTDFGLYDVVGGMPVMMSWAFTMRLFCSSIVAAECPFMRPATKSVVEA